MTLSIFRFRKLKLVLLSMVLFIEGNAQTVEGSVQSKELHATLVALDSVFVKAVTEGDVKTVSSFLITDEFELYTRHGVDISVEEFISTVKETAEGVKLRREVNKSTFQSCTIANYGAVLTGVHSFHLDDKELKLAQYADFVELWKKTENGWKLTKLIDYNNRMPDIERGPNKIPGMERVTNKDVIDKLARMDSSLFSIVYKCKPDEAAKYFTNDLEFYHDMGGVTKTLPVFLEQLKNNFCGEGKAKLRREMVPGSLHTYEFEKGAIQVGEHRFYVTPPGQKETLSGEARFIDIWKEENGEWKISRVLSLDHRAAN